MRAKLTSKSVENARPDPSARYELWDVMLPGFGIRVYPSGRKTWMVMFRDRQKQTRYSIGRYPTLNLGEARSEARKILRDVQLGNFRHKDRQGISVDELIEQFIEKYARPKNKGWADVQSLLQRELGARHGRLEARQVRREDVIDIIDDIMARNCPIAANRFLAAAKRMFDWAVERNTLEVSPAAGMKPPAKERQRDRVLSDTEIRLFSKACDRIGFPFGPLFKLALVTAQRRGEIAAMRWSDIDFQTSVWTIPAQNSKNGRSHTVPLTEFAFGILKSLPRIDDNKYVFGKTGDAPASGFSRAKRRLDDQMNVPCWRIHDLRRTAASGMAKLDVAPHVIEKVLNHSSGTISGVSAVYNRYGYIKEKAAALELWSAHLSGLLSKDVY